MKIPGIARFTSLSFFLLLYSNASLSFLSFIQAQLKTIIASDICPLVPQYADLCKQVTQDELDIIVKTIVDSFNSETVCKSASPHPPRLLPRSRASDT